MVKILRAVTLASALPAVALSQQTWIVDPLGTGNFITLNAAIAAAAPGDTLLLRGGGLFNFVTTVSTALRIVAEGPQRPRLGNVDVQVQVGNGVVSLVGVDVSIATFSAPTSCDDVEFSGGCLTGSTVSMHKCRLSAWAGTALAVGNGAVSLNECTFYGAIQWQSPMMGGYCYNSPSGLAMAVGGSVVATNCLFHGGFGMTSSAPICTHPAVASPAVVVSGGDLRVTSCVFSGGTGGTTPAAVILNSGGVFQYDASTQFSPANTAGQMAFLPSTVAATATPGGVIVCSVETSPNLPAVIVASLGLHPPTAFPQATGGVWLDANAFVVLRLGATDPLGSLATAIPLPVWVPRGFPITVQGAVAGTGGQLTAGAPVVVPVR